MYEFGDKAGRLLAHQARQSYVSRQITQIQTTSGSTVSDHKQINDVFAEYYGNLYTSESSTVPGEADSFYQELNLPRLDDNWSSTLDNPLTAEETCDAINCMQSGKSPGPDGFTVEFFKRFSSELSPLLLNMYEALSHGQLPQTLRQASICLIPKKDKDPLRCESYRPISLLNVDCKILAKCIARRLERVLPALISPDQTGFIPGRHSFSNIHTLLDITYTQSESHLPEIFVALDAEKAFDRVEWGFLFNTLSRFGFGLAFVSWVKLLYSGSLASVRTNTGERDRDVPYPRCFLIW